MGNYFEAAHWLAWKQSGVHPDRDHAGYGDHRCTALSGLPVVVW